MSQGQHTNSRKAFIEGVMSGMIDTDAAMIVECMFTQPSLTERQIMGLLQWSDIYKVRRRMSDLIKKGVCVEDGNTVDSVTNKTVRVVRLANDDDDRTRRIQEQNAKINGDPDAIVMDYIGHLDADCATQFVGQEIASLKHGTLIRIVQFMAQREREKLNILKAEQ